MTTDSQTRNRRRRRRETDAKQDADAKQDDRRTQTRDADAKQDADADAKQDADAHRRDHLHTRYLHTRAFTDTRRRETDADAIFAHAGIYRHTRTRSHALTRKTVPLPPYSNYYCIPNNDEKYISFTKEIQVGSNTNKEGENKSLYHAIRFIDSFKFMAASLDSLVNNLSEDALNNVKRYYSGEKLNLVTRKGVYPYGYMDSLQRFKENKLPPKESLYSRLTDEDISDEDYQHAQKVWEAFDMEHLQDYHNLYNETDLILLADVFENFRSICIKNYELDPAHYYTAPGLAWDETLKITGVELELLTDIDMLLMIEKGIRGGVSMISNRYAKANNKYMGDKFVASEISKYIMYLDANNLYGWAMSKPLPTHGFKWMKDSELEKWEKYSCILEVDLEYPKSLHDLHNDYPLAPEQIEVNKVDKLIPNLGYKEKYILHYENLKQYLSLGLKLVKIHRGIKFEVSPWLKKYIDLNTNLRTKAKNEFEKDFFKLMNNFFFGKTMENIRNRVKNL